MYETIRANLLQIQEEIAPCKPRIIAVTKYFDENAMINAYKAGLRDFGESRTVEACAKIERLPQELRENSTFHFIGHLQTNKVKQTVKTFDYIHSVDSIKLAQCIDQHAKEIGKVQNILLQINNANEEQKFGLSKDEIFEYFGQIKQLDGICIKGVMNMAPLGISEFEIGRLFTEIIEIRDELEKRFDCNLEEISMGMSQDYVIAAQKGSTMLRVGRKLFK
ncbi:MAG: YggS family pyridoxal phosphate-dependent enzyme [Cyanobacteria bacterium SIG26]|nr:YggS family pyridoxal phosphate-dependent enzyme [Cyanobacteria bacterium SIG26]